MLDATAEGFRQDSFLAILEAEVQAKGSKPGSKTGLWTLCPYMVESQQLWGFFLSRQVPSDLVNLHNLFRGSFSSAVTLGHSLEGAHVPSLEH